MHISIGEDSLKDLLRSQLRTNFLLEPDEEKDLLAILPGALERAAICFAENVKFGSYWTSGGELTFSPYNSGQYTIFLYFLANAAGKLPSHSLADKLFSLNKMMNGCEIHYRVQMPDIFCPSHSVGAVMGSASYGDYFVFQQNCTVGGNHGNTPTFGEFVRLFAGATVIGGTTVGSNVFISTGCLVKDEVIPDNSIVFGRSPNLVIKQKPPEYFHRLSFFKKHQP